MGILVFRLFYINPIYIYILVYIPPYNKILVYIYIFRPLSPSPLSSSPRQLLLSPLVFWGFFVCCVCVGCGGVMRDTLRALVLQLF